MNSHQRPAKSAFADPTTGEGRFRHPVARGFNLRAPTPIHPPHQPTTSPSAYSSTGEGRFRHPVARGFNLRAHPANQSTSGEPVLDSFFAQRTVYRYNMHVTVEPADSSGQKKPPSPTVPPQLALAVGVHCLVGAGKAH